MNQAIQFPEREWQDAETGAICFIALVNGFQVTCAIHGEALLRRYPQQDGGLSCFRAQRWDLEEEAEQAIKDRGADNQGWVWLS